MCATRCCGRGCYRHAEGRLQTRRGAAAPERWQLSMTTLPNVLPSLTVLRQRADAAAALYWATPQARWASARVASMARCMAGTPTVEQQLAATPRAARAGVTAALDNKTVSTGKRMVQSQVPHPTCVAAMEASEILSRAQCTRGRRTRVQAEAEERGNLYTATANSSVRSAAAARHRGERELDRGAAIGSAVSARWHDEPRADAGDQNGWPMVAAALGCLQPRPQASPDTKPAGATAATPEAAASSELDAAPPKKHYPARSWRSHLRVQAHATDTMEVTRRICRRCQAAVEAARTRQCWRVTSASCGTCDRTSMYRRPACVVQAIDRVRLMTLPYNTQHTNPRSDLLHLP